MTQAIGRRYVRYLNQTYRRTGTPWEKRFKSALIDSEAYLLACSRYIELNPLRARMVQQGTTLSGAWYTNKSLVQAWKPGCHKG